VRWFVQGVLRREAIMRTGRANHNLGKTLGVIMARTYVITGAASGIGAATAHCLRERSERVIACDLSNADVVADPERRAAAGQMVPMRVAFPGRPEQMAAMLAWCVSAENSLMTGQILFVDGGAECLARGERSW
jgi:NAD(P)-dependent dehydrogenase (short-subunit alcohol dehydrogenase family)